MAPPPSIDHRSEVLRTLEQIGPSTVTELMRAAGPEQGGRRKYRQLLRALLKDGTVVLDKKGRLSLPRASSGEEGISADTAARGRSRRQHRDDRPVGGGARTKRIGLVAGTRHERLGPGSGEQRPVPGVTAGERDFPRAGRRHVQSEGAFPAESPGRSVARFEGHREGFGFVNPTDGSRDVFIPPHRTGGALHGDLVEYRVVGTHAGGRREGTVVRVARPSGQQVVGLVTRDEPEVEVVPFDARAGTGFSLGPHRPPGVEEGVAVVIEVARSGGRHGRSKLLEILGPITQPGVDLEILVRKHHLRVDFPATVLRASERIPSEVPEEDLELREDFSGATVVTIDGDTAKDFDDAVSITLLAGGGYELAVHIADVSHYVHAGGEIDIEARQRGTSVYFPGRAIPMLPPALSEGICSLKPQVRRLVQSAIMGFDATGQLTRVRFADGWIRSRARLTYGRVNALLKGAAPSEAETPLMGDITRMSGLAARLSERRAARGGLDFDLPEPEVVLDALGAAAGVRPTARGPAQRMIEEFMIAANIAVAGALVERRAPALHRVHEQPDPLKVAEFAKIAAAFGYEFPRDYEKVRPSDFRRFLDAIAGRPEERTLGRLLLRTMALARYSPESLGHFGLAAEEYLHFTSPIRRYPDLVAHRALRDVRARGRAGLEAESGRAEAVSAPAGLKTPRRSAHPKGHSPRSSVAMRRRSGQGQSVQTPTGDLDVLAAECSRLERTAEFAERDSLAWKRAEVLMGRVGDEMAGTISWVTPQGLFVELEEVFAEGLLPISALPRDHYILDGTGLVLTGETGGKAYKAGQPMVVLVARVDRISQRVELGLVGSSGGGVSTPPPRVGQYAGSTRRTRSEGRKAGPKRGVRKRGR